MSIRHSILGLLAAAPRSGYQLKKDFEELTADVWPLNDGQVYTTLQRLQRDGLVTEVDIDDAKRFELTDAGNAELDDWLDEVRPPSAGERDELTIKVALALGLPSLSDRPRLSALIGGQRTAVQAELRRVTRQLARLPADSVAQAAVLDAAIGRLDAESRWLDAVEARLEHLPAEQGDAT